MRVADRALLELIGGWVAGTGLRAVAAGTRRQEWLRAMVKFQQLSAPTAAKSVEDTAFYRYGRLLSRNDFSSHADTRTRNASTPSASPGCSANGQAATSVW